MGHEGQRRFSRLLNHVFQKWNCISVFFADCLHFFCPSFVPQHEKLLRLYLIINMLWVCNIYCIGQQIDFSNVSIATSIEEVNVSLSIKMTLVCVVRFCVVYFLLDFFILTIYAVTSLFQLINLEMLSKQPTYNIRGNKVMEDKLVLKKEYPILSIISKIAIGISVVGIIAYEWENIVSAFQRLF